MSVAIPEALLWALVGGLALGWLAFWLALRSRRAAKRELSEVRSRKRSQSTRYGQLTEQFAPWIEAWPFETSGFRFLGAPIDGVQFTEDAVYLVEVKTAGSRMSSDQRRIRELVERGRVGFAEVQIAEDGGVELLEPWQR